MIKKLGLPVITSIIIFLVLPLANAGLFNSGDITFSINQNHTLQVELLAAIYYLKGLDAIELNQKPVAKASFEEAIKIQPDFTLAKDNLDKLQ